MTVFASLRFLYRRYWVLCWFGLAMLLAFWLLRRGKTDDKDWQYVAPFGIQLPMRYDLHGIDVSHHNRKINWERVKEAEAGGVRLQFAFIKATEGATLVDRHFTRNWTAAREAGLRRGAYHFYHPTRDPIRQADNFIRRVALEAGDFAPVLDFEVTNGQPDANIIRDLGIWLDAIESHYGVKPIIYTNTHLYDRFIRAHFDGYPLWIADYSDPRLDRYDADKLYLWQHNQRGGVAGVKGHVDFNVFVRDPGDLNEICL